MGKREALSFPMSPNQATVSQSPPRLHFSFLSGRFRAPTRLDTDANKDHACLRLPHVVLGTRPRGRAPPPSPLLEPALALSDAANRPPCSSREFIKSSLGRVTLEHGKSTNKTLEITCPRITFSQLSSQISLVEQS